MPNKINDVDFAGNTILTGYQPPWIEGDEPAWQQNVGYQIAGLIGMGMFARARLRALSIRPLARPLRPAGLAHGLSAGAL